MSEMIIWEADYILYCFIWGIILMLSYDAIRIFRIVVPHHIAVIAVEDVIYWIFAGIGMFLVLYQGNDGAIRWYAIGAAVLGMVLINSLVSRFMVPFIGKILLWPLHMAKKVLKIIVGFLLKPLKYIMKKIKIHYKHHKEKEKKKRKRWFHGKKKKEKTEEEC